MPKQVSALNTFLIVQYVDENYPEVSMAEIVNRANKNNIYFVDNLKTGKIEPISRHHLANAHYWFSNRFIIDLYEELQKAIPDPELFFKMGKTIYKSKHFFKIAMGMPLFGPYRALKKLTRENSKYNRIKDYFLLKNSKGHAIFRIVHRENIIINPATMMWNMGVFDSYTRLTGASDVKVTAKCIEQGPGKEGDPGRGIWEFDIKFKDHRLFERLFNSLLYLIPTVRNMIDNANKIQEEHNEQILCREKIIQDRTDQLKIIQNKLFDEERKSIKNELRNISSELIITEERERQLLAEDLHDSVSQSLAISLLKLKTIVASKEKTDTDVKDLMEIETFLGQAINDMRSVTFQICPPVLYDLGLEAALTWLVEDINRQNSTRMVFTNAIPPPLHLDEIIKILFYRSVRELIINIIKHAQTREARITLTLPENRLTVSVEDNGIGFDSKKIENLNPLSFGLFSIANRFKSLGGEIKISSVPQKGTAIVLMAPLNRD